MSRRFVLIRLEGLRNDPEAFGSTFEKESSEPGHYFVDRLTRNAVFGGFIGNRFDEVLMVKFLSRPG
jgi:hypothetical protein